MKTFLCEYIHPEARKVLESFSEIVSDWERLPECDAAINRNLQMKREFMEKAKNLKVIAMHGTGLDSIDLEEAKKRGIKVFNTPYLNAASVAELNITLMLMAARKVKRIQNHLTEGNSFGNPAIFSDVQGCLMQRLQTSTVAERVTELWMPLRSIAALCFPRLLIFKQILMRTPALSPM